MKWDDAPLSRAGLSGEGGGLSAEARSCGIPHPACSFHRAVELSPWLVLLGQPQEGCWEDTVFTEGRGADYLERARNASVTVKRKPELKLAKYSRKKMGKTSSNLRVREEEKQSQAAVR